MPTTVRRVTAQSVAENTKYEVASKKEVAKILNKSNKKNAIALSQLAK